MASFDKNKVHVVFPNVIVSNKSVTKTGKNMLKIEFMGGGEVFFDDGLFQQCNEGDEVSIAANFDMMDTGGGNKRQYFTAFKLIGGKDPAASTRAKAS